MVSLGHPLVYFLKVSFRLFLSSVFLLLFGARTGHLSQSYFWQIICGFMTWPHPVLANFQLSWLLNKQMLHLAENCLQDLKWSYKRRGVVSAPICAIRVRNGPTSANQGCSTDSQGSCPVHAMSWYVHPPPSVPPFLLVQNLSSKLIVPAWYHVTKVRWCKKCHQWLKVKLVTNRDAIAG